MASKGLYSIPAGSDGAEYAYRQKVAAQYQIR